MIAVVCVGDRGGMLFNRRRIGSDRAVISDLRTLIGEHTLRMRDYSRKLFPENVNIYVKDDYISGAGDGDYVFIEEQFEDNLWDKTNKVVVYHWNRLYPFDVKFPLDDLRIRGSLVASVTFAGHSHNEITREVYIL